MSSPTALLNSFSGSLPPSFHKIMQFADRPSGETHMSKHECVSCSFVRKRWISGTPLVVCGQAFQILRYGERNSTGSQTAKMRRFLPQPSGVRDPQHCDVRRHVAIAMPDRGLTGNFFALLHVMH